ncbi:MAG: carbohydrate ABC transporter permease [Candidatus Neomarinimicrobiota bacterium]|nr:MAG: carbohydrate ABC transporter permease [Candidatus Neomarinimicrobiota bacterium]
MRKLGLTKKRSSRIALYAFVTFFGIIMILPFYYMIVTSFKRLEDVSSIPISLTITNPTLKPYLDLLEGLAYGKFMLNSFIVATTTTLGTLFFCSLAGYAFAKHEFRYKNVFFIFLLSTMLIPSSVLLVPGFLLMRDFGWLNTFLPLIMPGMTGAFGIFLARQFIHEIPNDFIDAARIDGASDFRIYLQIILPLSKPLLATLAILTFLYNWNNFISPLIYIFDESKFTLPLGLSLLQGRYTNTENVQMAGATLAIIPVLILFFLFQKQIVRSLSSSGLKG